MCPIFQKTLQKEKGKWEDAKRARIRLLHECGVLRDRLENCQVDIFSGEEISLMTDSASMADALDLLETSDNRIGLLLAEVSLFLPHGFRHFYPQYDFDNSMFKICLAIMTFVLFFYYPLT